MQILFAFILVYIFCWGLYFLGIWLDTDYAYMQAERRKAEAIRKYGDKAKRYETMIGIEVNNKERLYKLAHEFAQKMIESAYGNDADNEEAKKLYDEIKEFYIDKYKYYFNN